VLVENFGYFGLVMERRIIHDHQAFRPECRQQHFLDPCGHGQVGAACVEQHGGDPVFAPLSHDEIGSLAPIAGYSAEDFSASERPAMRTMNVGGKPTLIEIDNILPAMFRNPEPQLAKKYNSLFATRFSVPRRFF
jgi:hypothetical protein